MKLKSHEMWLVLYIVVQTALAILKLKELINWLWVLVISPTIFVGILALVFVGIFLRILFYEGVE